MAISSARMAAFFASISAFFAALILSSYRFCAPLAFRRMLSVMSEQKKPEVDRIVFTTDTLQKYFPRSYTPKKMEETIIGLLENWLKKRQRGQER